MKATKLDYMAMGEMLLINNRLVADSQKFINSLSEDSRKFIESDLPEGTKLKPSLWQQESWFHKGGVSAFRIDRLVKLGWIERRKIVGEPPDIRVDNGLKVNGLYRSPSGDFEKEITCILHGSVEFRDAMTLNPSHNLLTVDEFKTKYPAYVGQRRT